MNPRDRVELAAVALVVVAALVVFVLLVIDTYR